MNFKNFVTTIFAFAAFVSSAFACDPETFRQAVSNWAVSNGGGFGQATLNGPTTSFTGVSASAGFLVNQTNIGGTSSLDGGKAWSKSLQEFKAGSDMSATMNFKGGEKGDLSVSSGHNLNAGVGNNSLVERGNVLRQSEAGVIQSNSGFQFLGAQGSTSGGGELQMMASAVNLSEGFASAETRASLKKATAGVTAEQNIESGLSTGILAILKGPGSVIGSLSVSLGSTTTQNVVLKK